MKLLDLFSGIGGFSLAAHWLGWETIAFVEKEKFCQKVLAKNFNGVPIYDDIRTFSGKPFRGRCDIITGGFPCQPFSQAGKQQGRADERHLFPQMLRVISEVKPRWVVAENVRGILSIHDGELYEEIAAQLESEGYEVITFCLPASSLGAPHKRDRIWIVAHSDDKRHFGRGEQGNDSERQIFARRGNDKSFGKSAIGHSGDSRIITDTDLRAGRTSGQNKNQRRSTGSLIGSSFEFTADADEGGWKEQCESFAAKSEVAGTGIDNHNAAWNEHWVQVATRICRVDDGLPKRMDRTNRLKALGNAIVPQIAYEIFRAIEQVENNLCA